MPPKQRITKEMILERAFEMFCQEGMDVVNARSVAKALNCSTQPIFSYFSGMEELKTSLEQKAMELFASMIHVEDQAGDPAVNAAVAYARFAAQQKWLFKHLFSLEGENAIVPANTPLALYAHGLASVYASGKAAFSAQEMEQMIAEMSEKLGK